MKKIVIGIIVIVAVALLVAIGMFVIDRLTNPLRKSLEEIREDILQITPLGTSMEEVLEVIENKGWEIRWIKNRKCEYTDLSGDFIIGDKSIRAYIGKYRNMIFTAYINIYWGFDENSQLIEIGVRRS